MAVSAQESHLASTITVPLAGPIPWEGDAGSGEVPPHTHTHSAPDLSPWSPTHALTALGGQVRVAGGAELREMLAQATDCPPQGVLITSLSLT